MWEFYGKQRLGEARKFCIWGIFANIDIGEWEHKVIESVKSVIPESVSSTWHEWTKSMKKAEHEIIGTDDISEGVEMAGWGVEEAEKQNKAEASKCLSPARRTILAAKHNTENDSWLYLSHT